MSYLLCGGKVGAIAEGPLMELPSLWGEVSAIAEGPLMEVPSLWGRGGRYSRRSPNGVTFSVEGRWAL